MWNPLERTATVARVTSFPTPVELLQTARRSPPQVDSTEYCLKKRQYREFVPDSAGNFANLLLNCVADHSPLSEPSQLRMVAS